MSNIVKFPKTYPATKSNDQGGDSTCKVEIKENCFLLSLTTIENQFSYESITGITEALTDIETYYWKEREESKVTRYLVTIGEGKKFSNGLDIESISIVGAEKFNKKYNDMLIKLLKFPMPTIAALNGHCFAAGGVFAIAHDFRVMRSDKGYFCMNEIELNLAIPPPINTLFKSKLRDYTTFCKVFLLGHRFNSQDALSYGLVDEVAPIDKLLPKAMELGQLYGEKLAVGGDIYSILRADYLKDLIKALELNEIGDFYNSKL